MLTIATTLSCLRLGSSHRQSAENYHGVQGLMTSFSPKEGEAWQGDLSDVARQATSHPWLRSRLSCFDVDPVADRKARAAGVQACMDWLLPDWLPSDATGCCQVREAGAQGPWGLYVDKGYEGAWNHLLGFGTFTSLISLSPSFKWISISFINKYLMPLLFNFFKSSSEDIFLLILEKDKGVKERETSMWERNINQWPPVRTLTRIEPAAFWCTGRCPANWAMWQGHYLIFILVDFYGISQNHQSMTD